MSNSVTLVGNITRDPELRFTPSGQPTASFGLAVNRRWQNKQTQDWEEATSFFDVVCWRDLADNVSESLTKGARVIVTGRLEQRSWETPDGEKRSKVEVVADEIGHDLRLSGGVEEHVVPLPPVLELVGEPPAAPMVDTARGAAAAANELNGPVERRPDGVFLQAGVENDHDFVRPQRPSPPCGPGDWRSGPRSVRGRA